MVNILYILILFLALFDSPTDSTQIGKVAVIVHESVKSEELTSQQLLDIYTLNAQNWDDGKKIYVTDFKGDSEIRTKFYKYISINKNDMKRIWLRKQFSGSGTPPLTVNTDEEMIDKVLSKPGTIGYVPANKIPPNTRVIVTID
jgi:ABC-type phosphate transport system substrate-binding protein